MQDTARRAFAVWGSAVFVSLSIATVMQADDPAATEVKWTKALDDRSKRGSLHAAMQDVRGDTGQWSEEGQLQLMPGGKPAKMTLDQWVEKTSEQGQPLSGGNEAWIVLRTRQLDDNDRVWIDRIERRGNRLTIDCSEAVWQGAYRKNFTYHKLLAANLGKLEPGRYEATWILHPLTFQKFERTEVPPPLWPSEERPSDRKPTELKLTFNIAGAKP